MSQTFVLPYLADIETSCYCLDSREYKAFSLLDIRRRATINIVNSKLQQLTTVTMSGSLSWDHQFCLACDRQTDGATYCSESCRLSDFDKSSSPFSTPASSPGLETPAYSWTSSRPQTKFYLSPAYDFSHAQPYGSTPQAQSYLHRHSISSTSGQLTPSSSYSSLNSLQSATAAATPTGNDGKHVSEKARKQLRDYASSFEQARLQRRRSC